MAKQKTTTKYVCSECGSVTPGWMGRCPTCGKFGTIIEEIEQTLSPSEKKVRQPYAKPVKLSDIGSEKITN